MASHARDAEPEQRMVNWSDRIREAARRDSSLRFTSLMHHVTPDLLRKAYYALNRKGAPGVDGQTWADYGVGLRERLSDLHDRIHSGRYRARPSKRIWIPKPDGRQRPVGMPSLEDKLVQQALVWVLEPIYETDFMGFSYGYRPERSSHDALDALHVAITRKVSWVLDADLQNFFDTVNHRLLIKVLKVRIADPRVLRLIRKFLRAGVSEDGEWSKTEVGTPQGAVISPLLANIYLHCVLDQWVVWWRNHQARGEVYIVRYADDFVMGFQYRSDAVALREALEERLKKAGLTLHPEKTRLIEFGRFAKKNRHKRGDGKPETFDFLGFTHICSQRRSNGSFTVQRRTMAKRLRAKMASIREKLCRRLHDSVEKVGSWLRRVVQGHLNYFAVPGNYHVCNEFRTEINKAWFATLRRRSHKARKMNWDRFNSLVRRWIPSVRILHPYPNQRLVVTIQGRSRMR